MSGLQNRLNKSCRRCVLAPGTQLAPGAERGEYIYGFKEIKGGDADDRKEKKGSTSCQTTNINKVLQMK